MSIIHSCSACMTYVLTRGRILVFLNCTSASSSASHVHMQTAPCQEVTLAKRTLQSHAGKDNIYRLQRAAMVRSYGRSLRVEGAPTSSGRDDGDLQGYFLQFRKSHTVDPIPYTGSISTTPLNHLDGHIGHKKVTIVGCGQVGMATAYAFLNQGIAGTIALVDMNRDKLEGEAKDLEHGSAFHQNIRILASDEYSVSHDSHLVIITAGAAQQPGESRLNLLGRNISIMKSVIPQVLSYSPNAALCIVSNPCDIMTAIACKIAGPSVPAGRIFGSGTCLDSSRLRSLISTRLNLDSSSVQGYILGEHGDSSVPIWSSVKIGGLSLLPDGEGPGEIHNQMHRDVVNSAYDVIDRKGSTNWAIGLTTAHIGKAILYDTHQIIPLSTCVRGLYGIENDVFLSVPCNVGSKGVRRVINFPLTPPEQDKFIKSAETLWNLQKDIWDTI